MRTAEQDKQMAVKYAELTKQLTDLHAGLVQLNPAYKLVTDAKQWGLKAGIRLSNGKVGNAEENATLYIEEHSTSSSWSALPDKFYVRINAGWSKRWVKNWTFETKDLVNKVHEKMTNFLQEIEDDKISRDRSEREQKAAYAEAKRTFPGAAHYGSSSYGHQVIYIDVKLDEEKWGNSQSFCYDTVKKRIKLSDTNFISTETFAKILELLKEDHREQKERDSAEERSA
jgi:hypothetical protein